MSNDKFENAKLYPNDFWLKREATVTSVLTESHHLLLLQLQFVNYFNHILEEASDDQSDVRDAARNLAEYVESINSIMRAVDTYLDVHVRGQ